MQDRRILGRKCVSLLLHYAHHDSMAIGLVEVSLLFYPSFQFVIYLGVIASFVVSS